MRFFSFLSRARAAWLFTTPPTLCFWHPVESGIKGKMQASSLSAELPGLPDCCKLQNQAHLIGQAIVIIMLKTLRQPIKPAASLIPASGKKVRKKENLSHFQGQWREGASCPGSKGL